MTTGTRSRTVIISVVSLLAIAVLEFIIVSIGRGTHHAIGGTIYIVIVIWVANNRNT